MQCYRHPKVETLVSCGRCEKPLCTKCMVTGPAGIRCRDCGTFRSSKVYRIPPIRFAAAIATAIVVASVGLIAATRIPYLGFILAYYTGRYVPELTLKTSGRLGGKSIVILSYAGILCGAGAFVLFNMFVIGYTIGESFRNWYAWLKLGIALFACYQYTRER